MGTRQQGAKLKYNFGGENSASESSPDFSATLLEQYPEINRNHHWGILVVANNMRIVVLSPPKVYLNACKRNLKISSWQTSSLLVVKFYSRKN